MKAPALLLLALVVLAAAPLAGAMAPAPDPASQGATRLQVLMPTSLTAGESTLVTAILEDANGTPIPQENVSFSRATLFGSLPLGTSPTNAEGEARVTYDASTAGNFTIVAAFPGDAAYGPSNTSLAFTVAPTGSGPVPPLLPPDGTIIAVILAVVGGVWITYALVASLILGIRADRPEAEETTSELKEKESMADDEIKPQRAPGSANASSRAVAIVAAVALVLGGLAVTLAGLSTFGGTKAAQYTPSTVTFDVSVVPDIRGDGWDSFLPDNLLVHAGDTVKLKIFNADEMDHGFAIDEFGVSLTVPAATANATGAIQPTVTNVTFIATHAGSFRYYCTVYCGDGHQTMEGTLTVLPDD